MLSGMKSRHCIPSPETLEDEEWDRVRMGYLSEADGHVWEDAFHGPKRPNRIRSSRKPMPQWRRKLVAHRAAYLANEKLYHRFRREIVVKAVSRAKSPQTIENMLRYVAKPRARGLATTTPIMHNEFGMPCADRSIAKLVNDWQLLDHPDTTYPNPRTLPTIQTGEGDDQSKRQHILAHHLVVSIDRRRDDPPELLRRVETAMHSAIDEVFTKNGYRVYWALHADKPLHPHIHIVVKSLSDDGGRLRFDKHGDYLHYMRMVFAEHLGHQGILCQATRRMDRIEHRLGMIRGELPLNSGYDGGSNANWTSQLSDRAPNWWSLVQKRQQATLDEEKCRELHATTERFPMIREAWERLSNEWPLRRARSKSAWPVRLLLKNAELIYADPLSAVHSMIEFGADGVDNTALASWLVRTAPSQYGALRREAHDKPAALVRLSDDVSKLRTYFRRCRLREQPRVGELEDIRWAERNIARVDYQRKKIAAEVLRVAVFCRDELDDARRAYQIRWELTHAFMASGKGRQLLRSAPKPEGLMCIEPSLISPAPIIKTPGSEEDMVNARAKKAAPSGIVESQRSHRQQKGREW